jgi:hypothetical protein
MIPFSWPVINSGRVSSYFGVAAFVVLTYDWALTFGQEVELVWKQRWSLMTALYLSVRCLGILFSVMYMLYSVPTISSTDAECWIKFVVWYWARALVFAMLWVILITRLHAMYQRSRKILIFLITTFLAYNIFSGVVAVMATIYISGEELILSGTYQCSIGSIGIGHAEDTLLLGSISWIVSVVWEVLALCLAVWIAIKHFRELRQHPAGGIIGDCFTVLIKTHVLYFASFVAVSCFGIIFDFSPILSTNKHSMEIQIFSGFLQILTVVQAFVLGPRLVLDIREYHAKIVADSDAATSMTSIAFQERVLISTGINV